MRYQAMLKTDGKNIKYSREFDLGDRPFAIWDNMRSEWWKGAASGVVYYATLESADARVHTLNEGTFESKIAGKEHKEPDYHVIFLRVYLGDRQLSDWTELKRKVWVKSVVSGETSEHYVRVTGDDGGRHLESFYLNMNDCGHYETYEDYRTQYNVKTGQRERVWCTDLRRYVPKYVYNPRDEYTVEVKSLDYSSGKPVELYRVKMSLLDFVLERMGMLESVQECADWHHGTRYSEVIDYLP